MDVLADILEVTRLTGSIFCRAAAAAPWGFEVAASPKASFHFIIEGRCWLVAGRSAPRPLAGGDLVLLPRGTGHALCDDPRSPRVPLDSWRADRRAFRRAAARPAAPVTELLCGTYSADAGAAHPVLRLLPPVIQIASRGSGRLEATLDLLIGEFERPDVGSSKVVSRLLDVLFIQILRDWMYDRPRGSSGWLGALRDPAVGRALALLHASPARPWTVKSLAAAARGVSRAVLARRFKDLVGVPPLTYLTRVRLDEAARLLRTTDDPLSSVARSVGYGSEFAFNRAFRRARGAPPGRFRRTARASAEREAAAQRG